MLSKYTDYLKLMNYSDKTIEGYTYDIKVFMEYLKTEKGTDSPIMIYNTKREYIINYMVYLNYTKENSSTTRRRKFYAIKSFYNWITKIYNIDNPIKDIKFTVLHQKLPRALSLDQAKSLINYYKDERNRLIIYLFLNTGMRVSELVNVKIENIYSDSIIVKGKGNKTRKVYLNKKCQQMVYSYINGRKEGKLFNLQKNRVQVIVKNALKEIGCEDFSTHSLRHTAATLMYRNTHDILLVKEFLRHESLAATQIYMHIDNNLVRDAVNSNPLANF